MKTDAESAGPRPGVWFPQWAGVLGHLRLPALHRPQFRSAMLTDLRYCQ
jgi:hypothetical protein